MSLDNIGVVVAVKKPMNKFLRFPNLARKVLKNDLMLYRDVVFKQRAFILNHAETYKLPKAAVRKNLSHYDKILSAIDLVLKSPN